VNVAEGDVALPRRGKSIGILFLNLAASHIASMKQFLEGRLRLLIKFNNV